MCQIHTITKQSYEDNTDAINLHLEGAAECNPHGHAALFINDLGEHTLIRTMNYDVIKNMMLLDNEWERVVIHQRYTTQGETNIMNTHMWQVGSMFYCHNGILKSPEKDGFAVDSQLIGHYLESGYWNGLQFCQSEEYANVFIVDIETRKMTVSRSKTNTLFTDGKGQYSSTVLVGIIDIPVPTNSIRIIDLDIADYDEFAGYEPIPSYVSYNDIKRNEDIEEALYEAYAKSDIEKINYYNNLLGRTGNE
jgi:hypothetical protein